MQPLPKRDPNRPASEQALEGINRDIRIGNRTIACRKPVDVAPEQTPPAIICLDVRLELRLAVHEHNRARIECVDLRAVWGRFHLLHVTYLPGFRKALASRSVGHRTSGEWEVTTAVAKDGSDLRELLDAKPAPKRAEQPTVSTYEWRELDGQAVGDVCNSRKEC